MDTPRNRFESIMQSAIRTAATLLLLLGFGCGERLPPGTHGTRPLAGPVPLEDTTAVALEYVRRSLVGDGSHTELHLPPEHCPEDLRRWLYHGSAPPLAPDPAPFALKGKMQTSKGAGNTKSRQRYRYKYTRSAKELGVVQRAMNQVGEIRAFELLFKDGSRTSVLVALRPRVVRPVDGKDAIFDAGDNPSWGVVPPPQ